MTTPHLDAILGQANSALAEYHGAPRAGRDRGNWITCADGFRVSVVTGYGTYCTPRPDMTDDVPDGYAGPFTHAEVGFPSVRPEPWAEWEEHCESPDNPTGTVYGYVPAELIRALILAHGGEKAGRTS